MCLIFIPNHFLDAFTRALLHHRSLIRKERKLLRNFHCRRFSSFLPFHSTFFWVHNNYDVHIYVVLTCKSNATAALLVVLPCKNKNSSVLNKIWSIISLSWEWIINNIFNNISYMIGNWNESLTTFSTIIYNNIRYIIGNSRLEGHQWHWCCNWFLTPWGREK